MLSDKPICIPFLVVFIIQVLGDVLPKKKKCYGYGINTFLMCLTGSLQSLSPEGASIYSLVTCVILCLDSLVYFPICLIIYLPVFIENWLNVPEVFLQDILDGV